jgi:hypothetical protein
MGRYLRAIVIGVGIGLLIAPVPGQEMRRRLNERIHNLLDSLPQNVRPAKPGQRPSEHVSETERELRDLAETTTEHKQPHSLITEPFTPAYPEYVNPEKTPNS